MVDLLTLPEIFLFGTLASVMFSEVIYRGEQTRLSGGIAFFGVLASLFQVLLSYRWIGQPTSTLFGAYGVDGIGAFFKLISSILALISIATLFHSPELSRSKRSEMLIFILTATLGAFIAASANEILLWILGICLALISSIFLVGVSKRDVRSIEGGFKLYIYQALIVASLCIGLVLLLFYFPVHSLHLRALRVEFPQELGQSLSPGLALILVFVGLSIALLIGAFPAFSILPETLVAATLPAGLMVGGILPLLGAVIGVRIYSWLLPLPAASEWRMGLMAAAGMTLVLNSIHSSARPGAKRIFSWMFTTQSAFLLVGVTIATPTSFAAVFYQLLGHTLAAAGAFFCLASIQRKTGLATDRLETLFERVGCAKAEAVGFFFFAAILAGLPPFSVGIARISLIRETYAQGWQLFSTFLIATWILGAYQFVKLTQPFISGLRSQHRDRVVSDSSALEWAWLSPIGIMVSIATPLILITVFAADVLEWSLRTFASFF